MRSKDSPNRPALLSREEETRLLRAWQDKAEAGAIARLCRAFEPLVRKAAGRFRHFGVPLDDLVQEGRIGLIEAAGRFDTGRGVRFATYAIWWVRARLQEFVMRNRSIVRPGATREAKALFFLLRQVQATNAADGADRATVNRRAADTLRMRLRDIERMDAVLGRGDGALNARRPDSDEEWGARLPCTAPGPESLIAAQDSREYGARCLGVALDALSERERNILVRRRLAEHAPTLRALGEEMGLSAERVRQIEQVAIGKMQTIMTEIVERPADLFVDEAAGEAP